MMGTVIVSGAMVNPSVLQRMKALLTSYQNTDLQNRPDRGG